MAKAGKFFNGRLLNSADLTRDQEYLRPERKNLRQGGVVDGLAIQAESQDRPSIKVSAGIGLTRTGKQIALPANSEKKPVTRRKKKPK